MPQPFVHLELNTPDIEKTKQFYTELFGWEFGEPTLSPVGSYTTFKTGEGPGGGLYTMPGAPVVWLPYVLVEDIHVATDKAATLGAQVVRRADEVPGMGWLSIVVDPTGASIAMWQPKPPSVP